MSRQSLGAGAVALAVGDAQERCHRLPSGTALCQAPPCFFLPPPLTTACRHPSPQPVSHSPFISHYDNKRKESERGAQVTGVAGQALGPLLPTSRVNLFPRCWKVPSNIS